MQSSQESHDDWGPCPRGELERAAGRLRVRKLRRVAGPIAAVAALLVIAVGIGLLAARVSAPPGRYDFGGIKCAEVHDLLPRLLAGTLDPRQTEQVRLHLAQCPICKPLAEQKLQAAVEPQWPADGLAARRGETWAEPSALVAHADRTWNRVAHLDP